MKSGVHDALGRTTNRAINGIAQAATFDALGRVTTETNALGSFGHVYVGATGRIATNSYPNGQQTVFSYYGSTNDNRLQQIQNLLPNGQNLSAFSYVYDPGAQITTWTRQADANAPTVLSLSYDSGDQSLSAILTTNTANGAVLSQYLYGYDPAGNRLSEEIQSGTNNPPAVTGAGYNNLNQLTNLSGTGGPMLFWGSLDKPGTVSVNGVAAFVDPHTTNFTGYAGVSAGTNVVQVVAADSYGNSRTNNYQIVVTNNGVAQTITYDLNGNQASAITSSATNTYEWDGEDRLTAINAGTNRSEFTYDGLGRRVQIIEKQNGTVVSTKKFVWVGMQISEERDSTGATVTKRFFAQGQINGTTNLYYARDHLGTVREMTDATGTIRARYDYDPYGRRNKLAGDLEADFAFTGHYLHAGNGLYLAPYRAYDPNTARLLSRDPLGEAAGLNTYAYVADNPANAVDPLGLAANLEWQAGWHVNVSRQGGTAAPGYTVEFGPAGELIFGPLGRHPLPAKGPAVHFQNNFINNTAGGIRGLESINSAFLKHASNPAQAERIRAFRTAYIQTVFPDGPPPGLPPRLLGGFGNAAAGLAIVGGLLFLLNAEAVAQNVTGDMLMFQQDCESKKDDWAYVDLLDMRNQLNQLAPGSGDLALNRMLSAWK